MKLINENGYLLYSEEEDEITLDLVCVKEARKGTGSVLVRELQTISRKRGLKISLYAEPCALCSSTEIDEDSLLEFYEKIGFEKDPDNIDGKLLTWK